MSGSPVPTVGSEEDEPPGIRSKTSVRHKSAAVFSVNWLLDHSAPGGRLGLGTSHPRQGKWATAQWRAGGTRARG